VPQRGRGCKPLESSRNRHVQVSERSYHRRSWAERHVAQLTFWTEEEFKPIAEAMDAFFRDRGWLVELS
jgi:hypothetical protein